MEIVKRVMFVGPLRLGTSLTQQVLSSNLDFSLLTETHYFQLLLRTDAGRSIESGCVNSAVKDSSATSRTTPHNKLFARRENRRANRKIFTA